MAVDTRGWSWCNLGKLSPDATTLSETHLQGSGGGVIKVTGTINLSGIYRPSVGAEVFLAASDGQRWICRIPRKLRVIDSFADPLRKITTVSVGCKFAYFENRKAPVLLRSVTEEEANPFVTQLERELRTQTISSKFVAEKILQELGLTAASSIPFTSHRIMSEWDLSGGYVQELAKIAEAECYRCRLNEYEQVEFISLLNQGVSAAPLLTENQLVDISPQTVGDLPAEAVYASYSYNVLRPQPKETDTLKRHWERDESTSVEQYIHNGPDEIESGTFVSSRRTETEYDTKDRVKRRVETSVNLTGTTIATTEYTYEAPAPQRNEDGTLPPPDEFNDYTVVQKEEYRQTSPIADIAGSCGFEGSLGELRALGTYLSAKRTTEYDRDKASGITKQVTRNWVPFGSTPFGSDAVQKSAFDMSVGDLIASASALVEYGSEVSIRTEREYGLRKRPSQQERNLSSDRLYPNFAQRSDFAWITGSATSQTSIELSPPFVSDDRMEKSTVNGVVTWTYQPSDAYRQALNYARTENKLLLGNRSGAGIQIRLIDAPARPFDLFYLRMNNCTAAYRSNGMTWTIKGDGIIVSVDALFMGAIDGNINDAWFPLPSGITSLPNLYAITTNSNPLPPNAINIPSNFDPTNVDLTALFASLPSGQAPVPAATLNPSAIVLPYQETLPIHAGIQVGLSVEIVEPDLPAQSLVAGVDVAALITAMPAQVSLIAGIEVGLSYTEESTASDVVFQLQMSGSNGSTTFTDLSPNAIAVTTGGGAQVNGNELLLDGDDDYLYAESSALVLTSDQPWTVEMFVTPLDIPFYSFIGIMTFFNDSQVDQNGSPIIQSGITLGIMAGYWAFGDASMTTDFELEAQVNTKVHVAIVASGDGTFRLAIAGTFIATRTFYGVYQEGANKLYIGKIEDPNINAGTPYDLDFNGKIGPFRITSAELYTGATFTPPTSFPNP